MNEEINWKELRDKFFKECTDDFHCCSIKTNVSSHDLFEWFKKELFQFTLVIGESGEEEKMNIPQRRELEKSKLHVCRKCGTEFNGWSSDNIQNTYLSCKCPCGEWNIYKYWGTTSQQH